MSSIRVFFVLICLAALPPASTSISEAVGGMLHIPSAASLAHCRTRCGDVDIYYPFGIGPGCFRQGFELTCDDNTHPPMLVLGNSTQINGISIPKNSILTPPIIFNITKSPGLETYKMSWEAPVKGVIIDGTWNLLYVVGCGLELHMLNYSTNNLVSSCMSICTDDKEAMEKANTDGYCHGTGCCFIALPYSMGAFGLKIVLRDGTMPQADKDLSSVKVFSSHNTYTFHINELYSNQVNTSSLQDLTLNIAITDEPNCQTALKYKRSYACNDQSVCLNLPSTKGYSCWCQGNPYILDGCVGVYNPKPKDNCTRSCGKTMIPFPFGLEEGCFGNEDFRLNCTSSNLTVLDRGYAQFHVTTVSVDDGYMLVTDMLNNESSNNDLDMLIVNTKDGELYGIQDRSTTMDGHFDFSEEDQIKFRWAVANLTCREARLQNSTYACLGDHTHCLDVIHGKTHLGYRCKCCKGFEGNPYVQHGCTDIDECSLPNYCQGTCKNYEGGFNCTSCSHGKAYDQTKGKCVTSAKQHNLTIGITIGAAGALGSLMLIIGAIVLANKWKKGVQRRIRRAYFKKNQGLLLQHLTSEGSTTNMPRMFSLKELEEASNNFDDTRILGCGGHGIVYKGILSDQRIVAIKKSITVKQTEIHEFINEAAILSRIIHRNVVKLFGCCLEAEVPLLVYEFMSSGSLYDILHKDFTVKCFLSWNDRVRVAVEAAGALAYLHSTAAVQIFHRDLKSSNILLDDSFIAKVSDFGLSRSLLFDETHVATKVKGTFGYLDPEYYSTGKLTKKSDVYSLGVILVELLTRKKPILVQDSGTRQSLFRYFIEQLRDGALMEIIDSQVVEEAQQEDIEDFASLAEACLRINGRDRPTMEEVEMKLQFLRTRMLRRNNRVHVQPQA